MGSTGDDRNHIPGLNRGTDGSGRLVRGDVGGSRGPERCETEVTYRLVIHKGSTRPVRDTVYDLCVLRRVGRESSTHYLSPGSSIGGRTRTQWTLFPPTYCVVSGILGPETSGT